MKNVISLHRLLLSLSIIIGTIFSYSFQPLAARILGPEQFGFFAGSLAIFSTISIAFSWLSPASAISAKTSDDQKSSWKLNTDKFFSDIIFILLPVALSLLSISILIGQTLKLGKFSLGLVFLQIPITATFAVAVGRLQSKNANQKIYWFSALFTFFRVATLLPIYFFDLGATTLIIELLTVSVLATAIMVNSSKRINAGTSRIFTRASFNILILYLAFWLFQSLDLIVAQKNLIEFDSGNYAGSVTIGRSVLILTTVLVQLYFPKILHSSISSGDVNKIKTFISKLTLNLGVFALIVLSLFGLKISNLVLGEDFIVERNLLVLQALNGIVLSFNYLYLIIFVVTKNINIFPIYFFGMFSFLISGMFIDSMLAIAIAFLTINLVILIFSRFNLKL